MQVISVSTSRKYKDEMKGGPTMNKLFISLISVTWLVVYSSGIVAYGKDLTTLPLMIDSEPVAVWQGLASHWSIADRDHLVSLSIEHILPTAGANDPQNALELRQSTSAGVLLKEAITPCRQVADVSMKLSDVNRPNLN